jgi:uncharacterized protein (UPF0335 family)
VGGDQINPKEAIVTALQASAQKELRRLVDQIERLMEERQALSADVADKFKEAKSLGFDTKALRKIIALRKKTKAEREEEEAILDVYLHALEGTPLGDWSSRQDAANEVMAV